MKRIVNTAQVGMLTQMLRKRVHRYLSVPFLVMLIAAFVLWYIAKLGHTYTTDLEVVVDIENQEFDLDCYVEGVGTNLFGYKMSWGRKLSVPIEELRYESVVDQETLDETLIVDLQSLSNAMSVRYSDIKIISLDGDIELKVTAEVVAALNRSKRRR
ncbi:MAG: hypothetical protein SNH01_03905 [Rikenellaceae bacterium]